MKTNKQDLMLILDEMVNCESVRLCEVDRDLYEPELKEIAKMIGYENEFEEFTEEELYFYLKGLLEGLELTEDLFGGEND